jgi:hypothetical protein
VQQQGAPDVVKPVGFPCGRQWLRAWYLEPFRFLLILFQYATHTHARSFANVKKYELMAVRYKHVNESCTLK